MADIKLTIDGRETTSAPGTTVLEAARSLGIRIPTLCHVEGLPPSSSCFLCSVQIEGARTLSPSCAMPVSDGMVVTTDSEDIRASRKMALELLLSDHAGDCIAPCRAACPAGLDVDGFMNEIARGQIDRSMETIYEWLSLPGALGRICPRLCEESCIRCGYDEHGLAIAALHRYATDRNEQLMEPFVPPSGASTGKRVAIVGAGPAGLTAAFYLRQFGHAYTLFDAHAEPGGMLRYGIPGYRLPRAALDAEIQVIEHLGAEFQMNTRWGRDFHLPDLQRDFDAVFIGIGAQIPQGLRCEGEGFALPGIEFLRRVACGRDVDPGRRVVVIGGGSTAMDAARTALRLGADVQVLYRRSRKEMPCLLEEVEGAEEEGVAFEYLAAPVQLAQDGDSYRLVCQRMALGEPDSSGRRQPVPIPDSEFSVDCDTVIAATGQSVALQLAEKEGLEVTEWGIQADDWTLATNVDGVFAGGDAVLGADLAVRAVAAGRIAATSIDQHLTGKKVIGPLDHMSIAMKPVDDLERAELFREIEKSKRVQTTPLEMASRLTEFDEIDPGLEDEQAREESVRCMTCGCRKAGGCRLREHATEYGVEPYRFLGERRRFVQDTSHQDVVYEPGKCIMCNACVRIASEAGEALGLSAIGRGFDVTVSTPFNEPLSAALQKVAHRCAEACPTAALALRTSRSCDLASSGSERTKLYTISQATLGD